MDKWWFSLVIIPVGIYYFYIYVVQDLVHTLVGFYRDWRILSRFNNSPLTDRVQIESDFHSLKTGWGRLRNVQGLKQQRLKPEGVWSQGLPYIKNDPASTLLAQLEERWLGLSDR
jgi:hypothetical protein